MTQELIRHLRVSGLVQGVGYRAGFQAQARRLGLCGWVRNRTDGSVEALVAGDAGAVEAMIEWAWRGPAQARVRQVLVAQAAETAPAAGEFDMLPTR